MQGRPFEARGPSDCACDCRGVNREGAERARSRAGGAYPDCDSPRPSGRERESVPRRLRLSRDLKSVMLNESECPARGASASARSARTERGPCGGIGHDAAHSMRSIDEHRSSARRGGCGLEVEPAWLDLRSRKCVRMLIKGTQHQFYSLINAHCQRARAGCSSKP